MKRPEWVKCIMTGMWAHGRPEMVTLCGRIAGPEFTFTDATHWLNNARAGGRLVGCPDCVSVILRVAQDEFGERDPEDPAEPSGPSEATPSPQGGSGDP